jgi:large subunit ribosomal protein L28
VRPLPGRALPGPAAAGQDRRPARAPRLSSDILHRLPWLCRGDDPSDYHPLERPVAAVCDVCGKGPNFGNNVSFSHRRTPRRFNPNIQRVRAMVGKTPRRLNVCTSCIKAGKVTR